MVRLPPAALLALGLCACAPEPQPLPPMQDPLPPAPAEDLSTCGGDSLLGLIGQDVSTLPATGGWGALRVIRPGMMVTMDYSDSRLNVSVDGAGRILALRCG